MKTPKQHNRRQYFYYSYLGLSWLCVVTLVMFLGLDWKPIIKVQSCYSGSYSHTNPTRTGNLVGFKKFFIGVRAAF